MDLFIQFALAAAEIAVQDAEIPPDRLEADRAGVLVGSGIGGIGTIEEWHKVLLEKGPGPGLAVLPDRQRSPTWPPARSPSATARGPQLWPRSRPAPPAPTPSARPSGDHPARRRRRHDRRRQRGDHHARWAWPASAP